MFFKTNLSVFLTLFLEFLSQKSMVIDGAIDANYATKYSGYKVFRAYPSTVNQLNAILHLNTLHNDLDFWTEPRLIGESVDIMVPPALFTGVVDYIQDFGIHFDIMIENIQSLIYDQLSERLTATERKVRQYKSPKDGYLPWNKFHRLSDIHAYMDALASQHRDFVKVFNIGHSTHGRELKVVKIGIPLKYRMKKPAIWIDAGIHAREWVAPATATYFIHQLVAGVARNDSRVLSYVRNVDWYILPMVNPDGYEYTHTSSRMWRKTRSQHSIVCNGVDPNRNFGFHWNENGASDDACSEIYAGPKAFSEPESVAMSQFLLKHNDTIKIYVTMHSYGQYWLTPWGFTSELPSDYKHLYDLAVKATEALRRVSGTRYKIGSSTNVLYVAAGGSDDWAKGVAGIKYSYTVELRDRGRHGFLLPQRLIEPTAKETWAAMMALAEAIIEGLP